MTDEQILRLICDHTGKRINLPNFTLDELKVFARAILAAQQVVPSDPITEYYTDRNRGGWANKPAPSDDKDKRIAELEHIVSVLQTWPEGWKLVPVDAAQPAPSEPETTSYVQNVPDKCDRIVWRGNYYHLPIAAPDLLAAAQYLLTQVGQPHCVENREGIANAHAAIEKATGRK